MATIQFWQKKLGEIYPNSNATITPDYMMAHLYTACSELCRLILRDEYSSARDDYVIRAVTWMIALANHFEINLEDALLRRFPNCCNYCLRSPCRCDVTGKRAVDSRGNPMSQDDIVFELQMKYQAAQSGNPLDFTNLLNKINNIYPGNRTLLKRNGQAYIAGKMLEEGGEVHRSYSAYFRGLGPTKRVGEELADLSGWVLSCWDIEHGTKSLDAQIAHMYVAGCPTCKGIPCNCPVYSITRDQEEAIRSIIDQLRRLHSSGVKNPEIDEALVAAEEAAAEPTLSRKKSLVDKLSKAMKFVKAADDGSDAIVGVADKISDAMSFIEGLI